MAVRFNGQQGTVHFAATTISVEDWKFDWTAEEINTTSTGDSGYHTGIVSVQKGEGTFKVWLDSSALLTGIVTAAANGALTLTLGNTGKTISGTANITKCTVDNPAEDGVTYECTFVMTGSFTVPS